MFAGPRYVAYKAYNLTKLKWKVWGGPRAEADGYYRPNSACGGPCPLQRVHVELAKPVRFWEGMLYTRFAVNGHWYRFFVRRGQGPIKALAVDPQNPQTVYALPVLADRLLKSVNGGSTWRSIHFSRALVEAFAFAPPRTLYVVGLTHVAFKSIDGGRTWRRVHYPFRTFVNTFAVAPSNSRVLYAGLSGGHGLTVFKSTDGGANWHSCNIRGKPFGGIDALAVDPRNPRVVYAVHQSHGNSFKSHVFKTTDGGRSWREIRSIADEAVSTINPDPQRPRTVYAASAIDGVFESTDAGMHFRRDGLRDHGFRGFVNQVVVNPRNSHALYTATLDGVLETSDAGRDWHRIGFPGEEVGVLAISSDGRVLYAGTDDYGVVAFRVRAQ